MSSTTDTRSNWRTWSPAYATAPPAACETLRNLNNVVEYGKLCVFAKEDNDPLPFSINTACMPWITPNVYPSPEAFYSPATACPSSWSAVSTATTGANWLAGETALSCCPPGFSGDANGACLALPTASFPVLACGDADAEENDLKTYTPGQWPRKAVPSISQLHLRYQRTDLSPTSTSASSPAPDRSTPGLSTAAKAAIGTTIPLAILLALLALFLLLRRRRKQHSSARALAAPTPDEKAARASASLSDAPSADAKTAAFPTPKTSETPEWNAELEACEARREASELDGLGRVGRKPVAPVEIDGVEVRAEVGDAYIPYRPGQGV